MKFRIHCKGYAILALAASAVTLPALAQSTYIGAAGNGNWSDPNNWNPAGVPGSGDPVNFINSDAVARTLLYDYSGAPITLNLFQLDQRGAGSNTFVMADQTLSTLTESIGTATFNQTGGTHTISGTFELGYNFGINNLSPVTHYTLANDATLTAGAESLGESNTAVFTQDGGTHTVKSDLSLGEGFGSSATYTLNAGLLVVKNFEYIGRDGSATFNQSGGTHTAANLVMGVNGGTAGTYNLSGGTFTIGSAYLGYITTGKGVVNILGGSMTVSTLITVANQPGSAINLLGGAVTTPTINLPDWNRLNLVSGTFNLTAYDRNIPGNLSIAGAATSSATMNFTGGNLPISGNQIVGSSGIAVFNQTAGTSSITGSLQIASAPSAVGTVNYSGGTVTSSRIYVGGSDIAAGGTGTLTLSGATVTASASIKIWNSPNSSMTLSGSTLSTPQLTVADWNRVIFNSGTLNLTSGVSAGPGDLSIGAADGSATLNLTTGGLQVGGSEYIGFSGTGTVNQNSGSHTASAILIGVNSSAIGLLNMSGGTLNAGNMFLGGSDTASDGKATVKMTAGAMTIAGGIRLWNADSTFALISGTVTAAAITTPDWNQFSFTQGMLNLNGGVSTGAGDLIVGSGTGNASATLNLSAGSLTVGGTENIGFAGTTATNGIFNQTGGAHSAAQLYLGYNTSSGGTYALSTGASLNVTGNECLGVSGQGTFNQTGGTHSLAMLQTGVNATGIGALNLSGGTITADSAYLGGSDTAAGGKGTLSLTGGTMSVSGVLKVWNTSGSAVALSNGTLTAGQLDLPDWNRLTFKSGTLNLSGNSSNPGTLSVGNSAILATLNVPSGSLTAQTLQLPGSGSGVVNHSGGSVTISQLLSIAPPQSQHGTYNLSGSGTLNASNLTIAGTGTALFSQTGGSASIQNAITVGGRGFAGTMNLAGGMISAPTETVASSSAATINHSSGTNSVTSLNIGSSDLPGTYNLSGDANLAVSGAITVNSFSNSFFNQTGGTLSTPSFIVGSNNAGTVFHSDGQATINNLVLGQSSGAGSYTLSATGFLTITGDEAIGSRGDGTFTQTGGTHTVQGTLSLVPNGRQSNYNLSRTGVLNTTTVVMGGAGGSSTFTQTGGTHNVSNLLTINSVSNSYILNGGDLNGDVLNHATFTQTAGTFTGNLTNTATLSLSGGTFNGALVNNATFNYSGGALNAPLTLSATGKVMIAAAATVTFNNPVTGIAASKINIPANATANFQGNVTGPITFTGTGTKNFQAPQSSIGPITAGGITTVDPGASLTSDQIIETSLAVNGQLHLRPNSPVSKTSTLAIGDNGILDIANNAAIIDYTDSSPINSIRSLVIRNAITSSSLTPSTAIGYAEASDVLSPTGGNFQGLPADGTSVLLRYTLAGDSNLDGAVGFNDLVAVAQHYGLSDGSATWSTGDFNYDGNIGFADLVAVAQNYGGTLPASPIAGAPAQFEADINALAQVPEPSLPALVLILASASRLTRRRRRRG